MRVESLFKPLTSETWLKNLDTSVDERFKLFKGMDLGVDYKVEHSGSFLYILTNEGDKQNYKVVKIPIPG